MKFFVVIFAIFFSSPLTWAKLSQHGQFYFADEPTPAELKEFKAKGGHTIIDLRDMREADCGEAITTTKLGLKYYRASMPKENPFTNDTIALVEKLVVEAQGKPVLIHCNTGNRAAGWLAIHLSQKKSTSLESSLSEARKVGLKSPHVEEAVKDYLKSTN